MRFAGEVDGSVALETALSLTVLVPLVFAVASFGDLYQRWLAQDAAVAHAARYAAELGGDAAAVRAALADDLRGAGIDPARVTVTVEPATVGWRQPIRVTAVSEARLAIPFVFTSGVPLRSSAIARGEIAR